MRNNNPYDPINAQPTEILPPMPDLPPKQVPQTPPASEHVAYPEVEENPEILEEKASSLRFIIGKVSDFLRWFSIVLEVILLIRFILMLIGADPANIFAAFIYALTEIILFPFSNIVHNPSLHPNQAFEFTTLIGMAIYWLLFWLLRSFVRILITEPKEPIE